MNYDWPGMDEVQIAQVILKEADACGCSCINISCDNRGAQIYFEGDGELRIFDHLPDKSSRKVLRFFKHTAGIEAFEKLPKEGFSTLETPYGNFTLAVKVSQGCVDEELEITVFKI